MSGVEIAFGPCWSCRRPFTFDAELVPSVPIDPATQTPADVGEHEPDASFVRQPICRDCVGRANANRLADGRELIHILPGAYLDEG